MKKNIEIILLFILFLVVIIIIPTLNKDYIKTSKIYINEIVASNSYTIVDSEGDYNDYIEIYNGYDYPINLSGYHLSDNEFEPNKWTFPDVTINAKSYLLIFASSKNKCDDYCHTNFNLSKDGETVLLTDATGNILSKITYKRMSNDISYSYYKNKYVYTNVPTPKEENIYKKLKVDKSASHVIINEYMSNNKRVNYDNSGYYYDWVELYNTLNEDINLSNLYLSDNINKLNKYKLPDVTIKGNGYLLIYLSGEDNNNSKELYANFKLSSKEELILSDGNKIIDRIQIIELKENVSYGRLNGGWCYYSLPTPNGPNNTSCYKSFGGNNETN